MYGHSIRLAGSFQAAAIVAAALLLAGVTASAPPVARAASTLYVGPGGGPGLCAFPAYSTIQSAVDAAASLDTIHICAGTYTLAAPVTVSKDLHFVGDRAGTTIIDGKSDWRILDANPYSVWLSDLTLRHGSATGSGGALNAGWANVIDCTFEDNSALGAAGYGGAIRAATLSVTSSHFVRNTATVGGGALWAPDLTVSDTTFSQNSVTGANGGGGAVLATSATVGTSTFEQNTALAAGGFGGAIRATTITVTSSSFTSNSATYAGAVYAPDATVVDSTFEQNAATGATASGGAIYATGSTDITDSTFTGNQAAYAGGAVFMFSGFVTATDSAFDQNTANGADGIGGAIHGGTVTLTSTDFDGNGATASGGAIYTTNGNVTITGGTFTGNAVSGDPTAAGGAIFAGTVTATGAVFSSNSATAAGGAIFAGTVTATHSMFTGNTVSGSGGAVYTTTAANVTDGTFSANSATGASGSGGAIYSSTGSVGSTASTFAGNQAALRGGAIDTWSGTVTATNSTFSANAATGPASHGGAISSDTGAVAATNVTFDMNSAGMYGSSIYDVPGGSVTLANTILAKASGAYDCAVQTKIDGGGNFSTDASCGFTQPTSHSSVALASLHLGSLASNGGPTQTIALGAGSVAIDAGLDAVCAAAPVSGLDQRGAIRPQGAHCDSGAYEAIPVPTTGFLRVMSGPALPTQVSIDGVIADSWGLNWVELAPGSHTVSFGHVEGFADPAPQTVTVTAGATTTVTGTFAQRGWLRVITSPAVAGTISVDGIPRDAWGMWTDLATGAHTVCFGPVAGYTAPGCQTPTLTAGTLSTVTGAYTVNPAGTGATGVGTLRVTSNPALPTQISIDGVIADSWGLNWVEVAPGSHTVSFGHVEGYADPAPVVVTVTAGATTTVTGTFVQRGWLHVVTSPAVAGTISVDGIPRDAWGMWTDLATGSRTVCFGPVAGHTTPPCQTPTLTAGATTTVTGSY
jgi:predicted outer membrane repeat protein